MASRNTPKALRDRFPEEAKIRRGEPKRCHRCGAGQPGPCALVGCPWPVAKRLEKCRGKS